MAQILLGIALIILSTFIGAFGSLLLKKGSSAKLRISTILRNSPLIWGFVLYGLSTVPFIIAIKFGPLSVLYPFVSLSYIWVIMLSKKYLKEDVNTYKIIGIALILAGVILIGTG